MSRRCKKVCAICAILYQVLAVDFIYENELPHLLGFAFFAIESAALAIVIISILPNSKQ